MTKITHYDSPKQVLGFIANKVAFGGVIDDTGVVADSDGQKIIPAGTPVGSATSFLEDEQTPLTVVDDSTVANVQGVLEHAVDVTSGQSDGTVVTNGYINRYRVPDEVKISKDMEKALNEKQNGTVVFFSRNK